MIREEYLAQEFTTVVAQFYPTVGQLLHHCYVKVIETYIVRLRKHLYYIAIYCSDSRLAEVQAQKNVLREVAEQMGLVEVVCMNATNLVYDPKSILKEANPRFWLELYWIATENK